MTPDLAKQPLTLILSTGSIVCSVSNRSTHWRRDLQGKDNPADCADFVLTE